MVKGKKATHLSEYDLCKHLYLFSFPLSVNYRDMQRESLFQFATVMTVHGD